MTGCYRALREATPARSTPLVARVRAGGRSALRRLACLLGAGIASTLLAAPAHADSRVSADAQAMGIAPGAWAAANTLDPPVRIGTDHVAPWRGMINEAAARFDLPGDWIERVMRAESGGLTTLAGRPIRSRKGAMGLMQLMPTTWSDMRARLHLGLDPDNPHDNVLAGSLYLRLLYDQFGYPGLFAAYNAGPARYQSYLAGVPLPSETLDYLARTSGTPPRGRVPGHGIGLVTRWDPSQAPGLFAVRVEPGETSRQRREEPLRAEAADRTEALGTPVEQSSAAIGIRMRSDLFAVRKPSP